MKGESQPTGGGDLLLGAAAAGVVLGGLLWAAGAVSASMTGHRVRNGRPLAGYAAFAHFGAPGRAWGAAVGPPIVYWTVTFVFLAVAGMAVWGTWRLWRYDPTARQEEDPRFIDGMATALAGAACCRRQSVAETVGDAASIAASAASRRCRLPAGLLEGSGLLGERGGFDPPFGSTPIR